MKFNPIIVAFWGAALSLPCSEYPKVWRDDGYGGTVWAVNPDCSKKGSSATNAYDNFTPAEDFPTAINRFTQMFYSRLGHGQLFTNQDLLWKREFIAHN